MEPRSDFECSHPRLTRTYLWPDAPILGAHCADCRGDLAWELAGPVTQDGRFVVDEPPLYRLYARDTDETGLVAGSHDLGFAVGLGLQELRDGAREAWVESRAGVTLWHKGALR